MDQSTITVGDFNATLSEMARSSRQKVGKDTVELNSTINQPGKTHIYRLLYPTTAEYTFFSNSRVTFTKIDHILGHETHINKF